MLERELSGYRFVGEYITRITNPIEIEEIEHVFEVTHQKKLSGVDEHIKAALAKLSDRKNPDYRNSIKESISAVESICKMIAGDPKATLGDALKNRNIRDRPTFSSRKGFLAIYSTQVMEGAEDMEPDGSVPM